MNGILKKLEKYKKYPVDKFEQIKMPDDFFKTIKSKLKSAEDVTIYSMYSGDDNLAKELLMIIVEREKLNKKTKIVLDKNRGLTKGLKKFIETHSLKCFEFKDISVSFDIYRLKKISAVFHSKIYIFDNEIILTGANFDNSYFQNRIDRYLIIKNEDLASDLRSDTNISTTQRESLNYIFKYGRKDEKEVLKSIFDYDFDSI